MSFQIELVDGGFIELKPNTGAEIERVSPFFSDGTQWIGESSTPITVPYTEENARKLGFPFTFYTRRVKTQKEATLHDNGVRGKGFFISESGRLNRNNIADSEINSYFVFGLSAFYQKIKDKKLRELDLGVEEWIWSSYDRYDFDFGFWQRLHQTWDGSRNWLAAPIRNENWAGNEDPGSPDWMNKIKPAGNELDYDFNLLHNTLVPQLRVKWILEEIFKQSGYSITFQVGDDQWEKLFMISTIPFDWRDYDAGTETFNPKPNVVFTPAHHLPDRTMTDFLVQTGMKYGWRYLINDATRECRVVSYRNLRNGTKKDWTAYAGAVMEPQFSEEKAVFSYTNEIDSNDSYPVNPNFDGLKKLPDVMSFAVLPAPTVPLLGSYIYTYTENSFWRCELDGSTPVWVFHGDNIFNLENENSTETIASNVSTLPMVNTIYRTQASVDYYGIFPAMKHPQKKDFGFRFLFYHGEVEDTLANGDPGGENYPHLSSLYNVPGAGADGAWSNVYRQNVNGDNEKGIASYWFEPWAKMREQNEAITWDIYLPRHELMNFSWDDTILIHNVPYIMRSYTEQLPYQDFIRAVLHRID